MKIAVAFANLGRGTAEETQTAVRLIGAQMLHFERAVLLLNEVDEADVADEHGLLSTAFRQWEDHAWRSKEPILTKGVETRWACSHKAAAGVPHQSPTRQIHEVLIKGEDGPDLVVIGGHYPAGAHNGQRSPRVKVQLLREYTRMLLLHRKRIRAHRRLGRHVIWAMDVNWRQFPRLHRSEGTLQSHGPDYLRVVPAKGWTASVTRRGYVDLPVEALHRLEWVVAEFRPEAN